MKTKNNTSHSFSFHFPHKLKPNTATAESMLITGWPHELLAHESQHIVLQKTINLSIAQIIPEPKPARSIIPAPPTCPPPSPASNPSPQQAETAFNYSDSFPFGYNTPPIKSVSATEIDETKHEFRSKL